MFTNKPVKYKYILLNTSSEFPSDLAETQDGPDSLRRYYEHHRLGPWAGWDSTSADTTQVQFTNLIPGNEYVFAVIAFDEAGAYSPLFRYSTNMIKLKVGYAGVLGPQITIFNEFFFYHYDAGGICLSDNCIIKVEGPADRPVTFNWFADPPAGADIKSYRWALDIENVFDETHRSDEEKDLKHWSTAGAEVTSATVGPFSNGEVHYFYVEAEDNNDLVSLAIVRLTAVKATLERPLLVVDDTRFRVDTKERSTDGCVVPPTGPWPTRAELDTFLFARGGWIDPSDTTRGRVMQPWKCYPAGAKPLPGIFAGYDFDTLGTRIGRTILTVPLSVIGHYKHIVWMVDGSGALLNHTGSNPTDPMTALRYMGLQGHVNTLAAYVKQGGQVWLTGGGAGNAVSDGFNDPSNDRPPVNQTKTYSHFSSTRHELDAGRFMYDLAKWQSEFRILQINGTASDAPFYNGIHRSPGRFTDTPQYAELPEKLEPKDPSTDLRTVEAPTRTDNNFYQTGMFVEFLQIENHIIEDVNPDPEAEDDESTLDTLYRVASLSGQIPDYNDVFDPHPRDLRRQPHWPIMTYYHGPAPQNQTLLMSGFPIWQFRRPECQSLVDYVLQTMWGLPKHALPATFSAARARPAASIPVQAKPLGVAKRAVPLGVARPLQPRYPRD